MKINDKSCKGTPMRCSPKAFALELQPKIDVAIELIGEGF